METDLFNRMNWGRFFHANCMTQAEKEAVTRWRHWPSVMDLNRLDNRLVVIGTTHNDGRVLMGDVTTGFPVLTMFATSQEKRNGDREDALAINTHRYSINEKGERHEVTSLRPAWVVKKVGGHLKKILDDADQEIKNQAKSAVAHAIDRIDSQCNRVNNASNTSVNVPADVLHAMTRVISGDMTRLEVPPYIVSRIDELKLKAQALYDNLSEFRERVSANVFGTKYAMGYYSYSNWAGKDRFFVAEALAEAGPDRYQPNCSLSTPKWFRSYADMRERDPELYNEIMPRLIIMKQARDVEYPGRYTVPHGNYNGSMDSDGYFYRNDYIVEAAGAYSYFRSANEYYPQWLFLDKGV